MVKADPIWDMMGHLFRQHPWHGVSIGEHAPAVVTCYLEMGTTDTVKYELDKASGILKVDRPQKYSNICPTPYGLLPQTYCGERVAEFCGQRSGREGIVGDGDPLDICILTEKNIGHGDILLQAIPIGGLRMLDGNEADDKIIAVMKDDRIFSQYEEIEQLPLPLIERLKHYFLTYKEPPAFISREKGADQAAKVEILGVFGREEAFEVIRRSQQDYSARYADLKTSLTRMLRGPWIDM